MEKRTTKGKSNLKGKPNPKKGKSLMKLISKNSKSSSESEDSEHELSYYLEDRVKLMKEVLKIIKPKKIKSMAPKWMRNLEIEEINSMLFEELLGISNKRLKCIFNGQKLDDDSSSTDPEEEQQKPIDVISLDDVTDDDFVINLDSDDNSEVKQKRGTKVKVKDEFKKKKIKKEKHDKTPKKSKADKEKDDEKNLMSVLELLELQARARAIRSQLALESKKKAELKENENKTIESDDDNEDAVIIESPKNIEILITSSESENEESRKNISKIADCQTEKNEQGSSSKQSVSGFEEKVLKYKEKDSEIVSEKKVGNESSSIKVSEGNSIEIETVNKGNGTENSGEQSNGPSTSKDHSHSMSTPANPKQIIINEQIIISKPRTSDIQSKMDKEDVISKKRQLDEEGESSLRNKRTDNDRELIATQLNDEDYKSKTQTDESNSYLRDKVSCMEENEGIIINVDQSEIECIVSD